MKKLERKVDLGTFNDFLLSFLMAFSHIVLRKNTTRNLVKLKWTDKISYVTQFCLHAAECCMDDSPLLQVLFEKELLRKSYSAIDAQRREILTIKNYYNFVLTLDGRYHD